MPATPAMDAKLAQVELALINDEFHVAKRVLEELSEMSLVAGDHVLAHEFIMQARKLSGMLGDDRVTWGGGGFNERGPRDNGVVPFSGEQAGGGVVLVTITRPDASIHPPGGATDSYAALYDSIKAHVAPVMAPVPAPSLPPPVPPRPASRSDAAPVLAPVPPVPPGSNVDPVHDGLLARLKQVEKLLIDIELQNVSGEMNDVEYAARRDKLVNVKGVLLAQLERTR